MATLLPFGLLATRLANLMTRRVLVPDAEITRVLHLAQANGLQVAGLDVGRDYVRLIPPSRGGESVADYIGASHSPSKAQGR